MRYYLTFGQKYRREEHPSGKHVHPDGYVVIVAEDYHAARDIVEQLYGRHWADLQTEETFDATYYPRCKLLEITVFVPVFASEDPMLFPHGKGV